MSRTAMFVDAGYLFAAGAALLTGSPRTPRHNLSITNPQAIVPALGVEATRITQGSLLRIYWYDAMRGAGLSLEQSTLALQDNLKTRFGTLNGLGQQKGVDNLLVTDLIDLARNRAISDAVVLTGDEDLRIAVTVAQSFGVRVHILGIDPVDKNMSVHLRMDADSVHSLQTDWVHNHLTVENEMITASTTVEGSAQNNIRPVLDIRQAANTVINDFVGQLPTEKLEQLVAHFSSNKTVPQEFDKVLLKQISNSVRRLLTKDELREIRGMFVTSVRNAHSI